MLQTKHGILILNRFTSSRYIFFIAHERRY